MYVSFFMFCLIYYLELRIIIFLNRKGNSILNKIKILKLVIFLNVKCLGYYRFFFIRYY